MVWQAPPAWPQRRPAPWDHGWLPRAGYVMPAMLRSRNRDGGPPRASTYQYAPRHLLYQRGSDYDMVPDHMWESIIKSRLPAHLWQGWRMIARNLVSPQCERETDEVATWISRHGAEHGFRAPNTRERGRAMGMMAYLEELELEERVLYDAQGNSFDPQAVMLRLQPGVLGWTRGETGARHVYPSASAVHGAFGAVLEYVRGRGLAGVEHPYPHDLREWILNMEDGSPFSQTPAVVRDERVTDQAAEHGRRER